MGGKSRELTVPECQTALVESVVRGVWVVLAQTH